MKLVYRSSSQLQSFFTPTFGQYSTRYCVVTGIIKINNKTSSKPLIHQLTSCPATFECTPLRAGVLAAIRSQPPGGVVQWLCYSEPGRKDIRLSREHFVGSYLYAVFKSRTTSNELVKQNSSKCWAICGRHNTYREVCLPRPIIAPFLVWRRWSDLLCLPRKFVIFFKLGKCLNQLASNDQWCYIHYPTRDYGSTTWWVRPWQALLSSCCRNPPHRGICLCQSNPFSAYIACRSMHIPHQNRQLPDHDSEYPLSQKSSS